MGQRGCGPAPCSWHSVYLCVCVCACVLACVLAQSARMQTHVGSQKLCATALRWACPHAGPGRTQVWRLDGCGPAPLPLPCTAGSTFCLFITATAPRPCAGHRLCPRGEDELSGALRLPPRDSQFGQRWRTNGGRTPSSPRHGQPGDWSSEWMSACAGGPRHACARVCTCPQAGLTRGAYDATRGACTSESNHRMGSTPSSAHKEAGRRGMGH